MDLSISLVFLADFFYLFLLVEKMTPIYLDNNATTRPALEVIDVVSSSLSESYGNPSSQHYLGQQARLLVEKARGAIAEMIEAGSPSEIVFTSGGTESIFTAFNCGIERLRQKKWQLLVSAVEHSAVFEACTRFGRDASRIEQIGVDSQGAIDLQQLEDFLKNGPPAFVSIMLANNETGVVFPIPQIAEMVNLHGAILHVDAVQAAGKLPIAVGLCDYMSLSSHKFHGLKGVGALFACRNGFTIPLISGHQENNRRGGTENVPGIIAMGEAARLVSLGLVENMERMGMLRDSFEEQLSSRIPECRINGAREYRLCNTSNIMFPGRDAARLIEKLSAVGVCASAGAACTNGGAPSHVLQAMGLGRDGAGASIRFSLSRFTTESELAFTVDTLVAAVATDLETYDYN